MTRPTATMLCSALRAVGAVCLGLAVVWPFGVRWESCVCAGAIAFMLIHVTSDWWWKGFTA